ncbi:DegV family protein [Brevibacillus daliensis]|uniref:DegV family protein n=1 Tax=Brevibacillus daliensis TaxID=2892995 RepID=UPI001E48A8EF|nr:DegV family protein [Brevibacillus daliensis]
MSAIVILTDSSTDVELSLANEWGIEVVPLKISFGEETFIDGVTINPREFTRRLENGETPVTSQPSPGEFADRFKEIVEKHGNDVTIIGVMMSSQLSGTYQSAVIGKSVMDENLDITIIDSKKGSMFAGIIAVEAAKMARAGASKQQILDKVEYMMVNQVNFIVLDTLDYLYKGGRIGRASALFGSLINIKPILGVDENGSVFPIAKVRGHKKAVSRMMEEIHKFAHGAKVKIAVLHINALEEAKVIKEQLCREYNVLEAYLSEIGPVVSAHVGPGGVGCVVVKE